MGVNHRKAKIDAKKAKEAAKRLASLPMNKYLGGEESETVKKIKDYLMFDYDGVYDIQREVKIQYFQLKKAKAILHKCKVQLASGIIDMKNAVGEKMAEDEVKAFVVEQEINISRCLANIRTMLVHKLMPRMSEFFTEKDYGNYLEHAEAVLSEEGFSLFQPSYGMLMLDGI